MLYYPFTLSQVAIALGLLYLFTHGFALWRFDTCRRWITTAHRNFRLGTAAIILAALWTSFFILTTDLMDYNHLRTTFVIIIFAIALLSASNNPDYLFPRALSVLILLAAKVPLDAAFLVENPAKHLLTIPAYLYVVIALFTVSAPYLYRDLTTWMYRSPLRARILLGAGCAFGALLLVMGLFVYP